MSKGGKKLIEAARDAVGVAKCEHDYVEGSTVNGRRVLRCVLCKATVHIIDKRNLR